MKYKIGELAKILDVSTNTVRRFEDMGYIKAVRDESSGYRYYDEDSVFAIINAKFMRKYGFSHEAIGNMANLNLQDMIDAYDERMADMDREIAYLTYLRHRIKDDIAMMKRAENMGEAYEKLCLNFVYVLYKIGDKLLTEPARLEQIKEFLYTSPEVQRICIIRKEDYEKGNYVLSWGWAVKAEHIEKYNLMTNRYAETYESRPSVMKFVKCQNINGIFTDNEVVKKELLDKTIKYMDEHKLTVSGDIIGIFVTRAMETVDGEKVEVQHMLMSTPV